MSYGEIIIALENIIVDKVSTVQSSKSRRNDTSAPMEIGMAAKEDCRKCEPKKETRGIVDLALQAVYKGTGKRKVWIWQRSELERERWQGESRTCWTCGKAGHIAAWCRKGGNKNLHATDEDDSENIEESTENEEDLQEWCLLEESENEQWQ